MKVLKFGGGVLKAAKDAEQMVNILKSYQNENLVVIVSAFNKITNKLEKLLNSTLKGSTYNKEHINEVDSYHKNMITELFFDKDRTDIEHKTDAVLNSLRNDLNNNLSGDYHKDYDLIVSYGEILSTTIIAAYLINKGINAKYEDIRQIIITDSIHTEAKVNWKLTQYNISKKCISDQFKICITQGFIAADKKGNTTTLGREGSDFTASVLAYALDAEEVIFWKEVDGIYNADPTKTDDYELLPTLSYKESVEQAFYGAKVLHPKTIKPLQNKGIPIYVKSFFKPEEQGTCIKDISDLNPDCYPKVPIYIIKEDQILISVSTLDFSFISEDNLGEIFNLLSKYRIKVNLMQSSAISFSVSVTNNKYKVPELIKELKKDFSVRYNDELTLITIRHYDDDDFKKMTSGKKVYIQQNSRHTSRFIVK